MPCAPAAEAIRCRRPLAASNSPSAPRVSIGAATTRLFTSSHSTTCAAPRIAASTGPISPRLNWNAMLSCASGQIAGALRQNGICDRDDRRQRLIVDDDSFGGIARVSALSATTKATGSPT